MARKLAGMLFLAMVGLAMGQGTPDAKAPAGTAATVNGQAITEAAVQRSLERIPPERRAAARGELINHLVDNMLVDQYLVQQKIVAAPAEVEKRLVQMKEEIVKQGKDYAKMLAELKLGEPELKEHIAAEVRWEQFVNSQANDKALRETFAASKDVFDGSSVRARHILLSGPNEAEAGEKMKTQLASYKKLIEEEVATGLTKVPNAQDNLAKEKARTALMDDAFALVAKEKSQCPSKEQGGDVGWFGRDGVMVEAFSKVAFALTPYQMSEPVKTQFGYHLIMTTEKKPGKDVKFEDVQAEVKEYFAEKMRERLAEHVRKFSKINIYPAPAGG